MQKSTLIAMVLVVVFIGIGSFIVKIMKSDKSSNVSNSQSVSRDITLSEVANHATSTDCWMTIEGKVYDVTKFIPSHPGGDAILQGCGKDATAMFNSRPNDGTSHSSRARDILSQYQIGVLAK